MEHYYDSTTRVMIQRGGEEMQVEIQDVQATDKVFCWDRDTETMFWSGICHRPLDMGLVKPGYGLGVLDTNGLSISGLILMEGSPVVVRKSGSLVMELKVEDLFEALRSQPDCYEVRGIDGEWYDIECYLVLGAGLRQWFSFDICGDSIPATRALAHDTYVF